MIIFFLFLFLIGMGVGILLFSCSEKKGIYKAICIVTTGLIFSIVITFMFKSEQDFNNKEWNNGFCPKCGESWRLVNAEHLRNSGTVYYYTCDKCGDVIRQDCPRKINN